MQLPHSVRGRKTLSLEDGSRCSPQSARSGDSSSRAGCCVGRMEAAVEGSIEAEPRKSCDGGRSRSQWRGSAGGHSRRSSTMGL